MTSTASSPAARPWRRLLSVLLALALGLSSVEIAWAEAFESAGGSVACVSGGGDVSQDSICSPDETPDADEDCPCLCACACPSAQRVVSSVPAVFLSIGLTSSALPRERVRAPHSIASAPQFRPPVA